MSISYFYLECQDRSHIGASSSKVSTGISESRYLLIVLILSFGVYEMYNVSI